MASPMLAASSPRLLDPQKKAHFNIQLSDRITKPKSSSGEYSSVKFNHKPQQTASFRTSTISQTTGNQYSLTVSDKDNDNDASKYVFRGQKTQTKKSYVLIFDPTKQTATLEPLSSTYTFNLKSTPTEPSSSKLSQRYPQIRTPKPQDSQEDGDDLFDEDGKSVGASDSEPDAQNPYDYRHFLNHDSGASSPDAHSSLNTPRSDFRSTPLVQAHKPPTTTTAKVHPKSRAPATSAPLAARKRKSPPPPSSTTKKPTPTVRLDRRASTRPTETIPKPAPSKSKKPVPKSAEIIHSSDDSSDEHPTLTIESPPSRPRALASLGLGQSLGLGGSGRGFLKSPSNGPISLHSAANSVSGSPEASPFRRPVRRAAAADDDEIDFGDMGGGGGSSDEEDDGYVEDNEEEGLDLVDADADADVEEMELGPPVQVPKGQGHSSEIGATVGRRMSVSELVQEDAEGEEDDLDFEAEMMQGLMSQEEEGRAKGLGVVMGGESESESEEE